MRVVRRHPALDPTDHGRASRERFPAPVKTTYACWPGGLDHVMADLRVRTIHTAIKLSLENDAGTDTSSYGHVDQARLALPRAPRRLGQSCGIRIVFHCDAHPEASRQIDDGVVALPRGEEIDFSDLTRERIDRTSAPNPDASQLYAGGRRQGAEHFFRPLKGSRVATFWVGRALSAQQHPTRVIYQSNRDLRATDINPANHVVPFHDLLPLHDDRFVRFQIHLPCLSCDRQCFGIFRPNLTERFDG